MKKPIALLLLVALTQSGLAQSLRDLLKQAEVNYPSLKVKTYEVQAKKADIALAKSSAIPTLDAAYQINYATYNNITGMAVGQSFVPISGPPSSDNTFSPVFGTAAGLLMNWDVFTGGQRKAKLETSNAVHDYQQADQANAIFQHQIRTISAYLDVLMAHAMISVHRKNVELAEENIRIVRSLTRSGLRPGTDSALFKAELSRARIDLLNFENQRASYEAILSEYVGGTSAFDVDTSFFQLLPSAATDSTSIYHPSVRLGQARLMISTWEKTSVRRQLYPKLSLWGTAYARGSGIRYDGSVNSTEGLSFTRSNYGAGLVLSLPLLRFASTNHQVEAQESILKAEQEKLSLIRLQLEKQNEIADITLNNSLRIANETPAFYESAEFAYRTLNSRYNSGLTNYADYIQAQYTLLRSESDLKRAYIEAWKALLFKAAVQGDVNIFLNQIQ